MATIQVRSATSFRDFFEIIEQRKRILTATDTWHKVHVRTDLPMGSGVCLSVLFEEEAPEFVTHIVVMPARFAFNEERHDDDAGRKWMFSAWRRMLHNGQLVRALEEFINDMDADASHAPMKMSELRAGVRVEVGRVCDSIERLRLASDPGQVEQAGIDLRAIANNAEKRAERLTWCRLYEEIGRYLRDGRKEVGTEADG